MADETQKLKAELQRQVPKGWDVFHVRPYDRPDWRSQVGEYRAQRRLPNGTLVVQHGDTPDELVTAVTEYDRAYARVEPEDAREARILAESASVVEQGAEFRPTTEQELAELAIEVQPVALTEKLAVEGPDAVTDDEKEKAGLTDKGAPKKGTAASIIPPGASPEAEAAVTGVPAKTKKKGK